MPSPRPWKMIGYFHVGRSTGHARNGPLSGCRVEGLDAVEAEVSDLGFRMEMPQGLGFRVQGSGFRV